MKAALVYGVFVAMAVFGIGAAAASTDAVSERTAIKRLVVEAAARSPVPPSLALAVAKVESDFSSRALSDKGARGVMQIMPATARGEFGVAPDDLWDARRNVRLGIDFLARLIESYGGRWDLALSHYNGGSLAREGGAYRPHAATRAYVAKVLKWERLYADQGRVWTDTPHLSAAPPRAVGEGLTAIKARVRAAARRLDDFGEGRWIEVGRLASSGSGEALDDGGERRRLKDRLRDARERARSKWPPLP